MPRHHFIDIASNNHHRVIEPSHSNKIVTATAAAAATSPCNGQRRSVVTYGLSAHAQSAPHAVETRKERFACSSGSSSQDCLNLEWRDLLTRSRQSEEDQEVKFNRTRLEDWRRSCYYNWSSRSFQRIPVF